MVIAERILQIEGADGLTAVAVRLHAPESREGHWVCRSEIHWPERVRTLEAGGYDAAQALYLAMQMIGTELYFNAHDEPGRLSFWGDWKGYGFPLPSNLRDEQIGADDRYYLTGTGAPQEPD